MPRHDLGKKSLKQWRNEFPVSTHANYGRGTITFRIRHEPRGSSSREKVAAVADEIQQRINMPDLLVKRRDFSARVDLEYTLSMELAARCLAIGRERAAQAEDPNQLSFLDLGMKPA